MLVRPPDGRIRLTFRVIARENIQSIGLLKLDAELADWGILNGVKAKDWPRIWQVAMEVHVESDVVPISNFLSERDFGQGTLEEIETRY